MQKLNISLPSLLLSIFFSTISLEAQPYDPNKSVTVYVHGFSPSGYRESGIYGEDEVEPFFEQIPLFLGLPTTVDEEDKFKPNVLSSTTYYGDIAPSYYNEQDMRDIEAVDATYSGGIPRYALIVAKYAKYLMERNGAQQVNFISASMGTLVTRWLIEKDLEGLASGDKIARWLSVEGVLNGNYAASKSLLFKLYDSYEDLSIDTKHMKYEWIKDNLSNPRRVGQSPYYKHILLGAETSTNDQILGSSLTKLGLIHGSFHPNDGYQIDVDTFFEDILAPYRFYGQNPTHTYLHYTHLGVKNAKALWAEVGNFITSNKRVRVTLNNVKVNNIKEKDRWYLKALPAEIIFESKIYSPALSLKWNITDPIAEKLYAGALPPIVKYKKKGETKAVNQVLFDDFVLPQEDTLSVWLNVREIDGDLRYKVYESFKDRDYQNIDTTTISIPLKNGSYSFVSQEFSGDIIVKVIEYPFPLLGEGISEIESSNFNQNEDLILERGDLIVYNRVASKTSSYMKPSLKSLITQYPTLQDSNISGVDVYRVVYTTIGKDGKKVNASGLISIPQDINSSISIISDQHGTIFGKDHSPSKHDPLTTTGTLISSLKKFVVTMPDFIGYGKSSNQQHPYQIKESLGNSIVDMIIATKELLNIKNIPYDNKLFLMGYSEGGYATMATAQTLQNEYPNIEVTAAAPMAGSYDLKTTGDFIFTQNSYTSPHLPIFLIYAYDNYYNLNILNSVVNPPYADAIREYFNEKANGNIIPLDLPKERDLLFQQNFLLSYFSNQSTPLKEKLILNNLYDWTPQMPLRLYHCKGDEVVPVVNSQIAYNNFIQNGSSQVELILKEGGTHGSCSIPFYIDAISWFEKIRSDNP